MFIYLFSYRFNHKFLYELDNYNFIYNIYLYLMKL